MVCIYCGSPTSVTNSRPQKRRNGIWRRRLCTSCGAVFTTTEQADLTQSLTVQDARGRLQPFNRDRLFVTLWESCKHRKSAVQDATSLTETVIQKLLKGQTAAGMVTRAHIVGTAQALLKDFDAAAATMYGAYHPLD